MSRERGSVTLVAAGGVAVALVLAVGVMRVGGAAVARARAQTAADAAALAAADTLALGRGAAAALDAAAETAASNGARLTRCVCTGRVVEVAVSRRVPGIGRTGGVVTARARAEIRPILAQFAR